MAAFVSNHPFAQIENPAREGSFALRPAPGAWRVPVSNCIMNCPVNQGSTTKPARKRIVILGGGFGGVYAALHLERLVAREPGVEICLVSRDNFFLFTPMLHEIAASDLEITNIVNPLRKLLRRVKVFVGEVERIDLADRRVVVSHGGHDCDNHSHRLEYDHLVLALGSITNFFDLPGLGELALGMKSLPDAVQLRARIIRRLEEANSECSLGDRQSLLAFVVAGGGFAGVETVAALNDFVREALQFYPNLHERMLRVVLVHPGAVILPELGDGLGRYAQKVLAERGVEIRLNTRVTSMTENEVCLNEGPLIQSSTLIWTAGTMPNPLLASLPCRKERGPGPGERVPCKSPIGPGVWAVGDCAFVPEASAASPVSSAHRATCHSRGQGGGTEHREGPRRPSSKAIFLQDHRAARLHRAPDGRRADSRLQLLGLLRVVAVAHDLSVQIARLRQEGSRRV